MPIRLAPLALALLLSPLAADAQTALDGSAAPRQGTIQASSDASGVLDIQITPEVPNPVEACGGYFTLGAPDAVIDWNGGGSAMRVWVRSALDGVLIVQAPTGETLCEDDVEGVQPAIEIGQAAAGRYAVWVGAFTSIVDASATATLYAGAPPQAPTLTPEASAPALSFQGMDATLDAQISADIAAQTLGLPGSCVGFIGRAPTARVSGEPPYTVTAASDDDLVLAILTASGEWLCDDDSGPDTEPAIEIPAPGTHAVWVGTFRGHARGEAPEATLRATADTVIEEDFRFDMPPPPPPGERTYFSTGTYTPLDLTSRGVEMPLAEQDDRTQIQLTARGEAQNPVSGNACAGALPSSASATVAFVGAGPLTLTAETNSGDLVMVARTASGEWFCSDDASGQDPAIEIANPGGDVMVWVGTFSPNNEAQATLTAHRAELIDVLPEDTEIYDEYVEMMEEGVSYSEGSYTGSDLTPEAPATTLTLGSESSVDVGGTVPNPVAGDACAGFISAVPSATVTAGSGMLAFFASGDDDLTMTVRTPDGGWYCSDDHIGLDPGIQVSSGGDGVYAIWLGTFAPLSVPGTARLVVEDGPLRTSR